MPPKFTTGQVFLARLLALLPLVFVAIFGQNALPNGRRLVPDQCRSGTLAARHAIIRHTLGGDGRGGGGGEIGTGTGTPSRDELFVGTILHRFYPIWEFWPNWQIWHNLWLLSDFCQLLRETSGPCLVVGGGTSRRLDDISRRMRKDSDVRGREERRRRGRRRKGTLLGKHTLGSRIGGVPEQVGHAAETADE